MGFRPQMWSKVLTCSHEAIGTIFVVWWMDGERCIVLSIVILIQSCCGPRFLIVIYFRYHFLVRLFTCLHVNGYMVNLSPWVRPCDPSRNKLDLGVNKPKIINWSCNLSGHLYGAPGLSLKQTLSPISFGDTRAFNNSKVILMPNVSCWASVWVKPWKK